jgi:hypothetical protein
MSAKGNVVAVKLKNRYAAKSSEDRREGFRLVIPNLDLQELQRQESEKVTPNLLDEMRGLSGLAQMKFDGPLGEALYLTLRRDADVGKVMLVVSLLLEEYLGDDLAA